MRTALFEALCLLTLDAYLHQRVHPQLGAVRCGIVILTPLAQARPPVGQAIAVRRCLRNESVVHPT